MGDKIGESKCALVYGQMNEPPGEPTPRKILWPLIINGCVCLPLPMLPAGVGWCTVQGCWSAGSACTANIACSCGMVSSSGVLTAGNVAGARARVALTGLTVAEYFRDQMGQDVLFFVDNIFRFTQVCPAAVNSTGMPHLYCASHSTAFQRATSGCSPCPVIHLCSHHLFVQSLLLCACMGTWLQGWLPVPSQRLQKSAALSKPADAALKPCVSAVR